MIPFVFLIVVIFFVFILIAPIFIFYRVFRNPDRRETDYKALRRNSSRLSFVSVAASLTILALVKSKLLFEGGLAANRLLFIAMIIAALGLVFGVLSFSRWQAFIAMANFFLVWIVILLLI